MRIKYLFIIVLSVLFTLFLHNPTFSQTYSWGHVSIGGGGFVDGIIISKTNPKVMYARTDVGGAYRWDSVNTKWVQMLDWVSNNQTGYLGVESIALDPQNNNNVYMLVGTSYFNNGNTAIIRSSDGGKTFAITDVSSQFKAHGNGMGRQMGEKLVVDPNQSSILFCGTRCNGVFKSTNSGATWTNVTTTGSQSDISNKNGISFVLFDPSTGTNGTSASQTIVFGVSQTSNNLYISTNGGGAFTSITGGPNLMPQRAVLANDRTLYIAYSDLEGPWNPTTGALWKYNLGTKVWTNITPSGAVYSYAGISVDPANPQRVIASTINKYMYQYTYNGTDEWGDHFYLSTNGGTSWNDLAASAITLNANGCTWMPGNTIHWAGDIQFNPSNTAQAFVISGNGLFSCDNVNSTASTWKFNGIGIEETVPLDIVSTPGGPLFSVIGDYDGFKHTDILTYAPVHTPGMGSSTGIAYAAGNINYLVRVGSKMYYTVNQGTTWKQCGTMNGTKGKIAVAANASVVLHCPEKSSTFYRSVDNGTTWSTCNGISITDGVPVADPVNNSKFYAYNSSNGSLMVSTDGGVNFSTSGNAGSGGSKIIRTVPGREGHLWVALYSGGLTRSTNSGASFTKLTSVTSCDAVGLGKAAPSATYETVYIWGTVSGVTGIFRSIDQGATWTRINDNAHQYGGPGNGQFVIGDWNTYGRVYMSTVGLGIVYGDLSSTVIPTVTCSISSNSSSICSGKSVTLTSNVTVSNGTINKVDFYDGTTLLGTSVASPYTYTWLNVSAGTHTITAKATDNTNAITTSSTISIVVNSLPTVSISTAAPICIGKYASLNATGATTYSWSNGTSSATLVTFPTVTTTYTVTGTIAGCANTNSAIVTVNPIPTVNAGIDVSICSGKTASLTASGGNFYTWSNAITTSANVVSPTITTTYVVTGTNVFACTGTDAVIVTVNSTPSAPTVVSPVNYILNAPAISLTATGTGLLWYTVASASTGNTTAPIPLTTTIGTNNHYVSQTVNSCESPRSTIAVIVTSNSLPTISITSPINKTKYISPASITINASAGDADGTISNVEFFNGTTSLGVDNSSPYTFSWTNVLAGTYTLTAVATDNNSGKTTSTAITVIVNAQQTLSLLAGWNIISFYVQPTDSSIISVFGSLGTDLNTIKNQEGFYSPSQPTYQNSLQNIERGKAYLVNVAVDKTLIVSGNIVGIITQNLKSGWNLLGYPKQISSAIGTSLSSIVSNTIAVKNFDGFWQPSGTTNSISTFDSGKGYFIMLSASSILSW